MPNYYPTAAAAPYRSIRALLRNEHISKSFLKLYQYSAVKSFIRNFGLFKKLKN